MNKAQGYTETFFAAILFLIQSWAHDPNGGLVMTIAVGSAHVFETGLCVAQYKKT